MLRLRSFQLRVDVEDVIALEVGWHVWFAVILQVDVFVCVVCVTINFGFFIFFDGVIVVDCLCHEI